MLSINVLHGALLCFPVQTLFISSIFFFSSSGVITVALALNSNNVKKVMNKNRLALMFNIKNIIKKYIKKAILSKKSDLNYIKLMVMSCFS